MLGGSRPAPRTSGGARSGPPPRERSRDGRYPQPAPREKREIELPDSITVRELGMMINASPVNIIRELMNNGVMATINQQLDFDSAAIVVDAFGFVAKQKEIIVHSIVEELGGTTATVDPATGKPAPARPATLRLRMLQKEGDLMKDARPPVVTIMGHVDHGKTSLLDAIRSADVAGGEAGGITQHIGAYQVEHEGRRITFLDTPGHEAFTAMRAAAPDHRCGRHRRCRRRRGDAPDQRGHRARPRGAGANHRRPEQGRPAECEPRAREEGLMESGLTPDDWGGDTMVVPVSAKLKTGIADLLEAILLTSESLTTIKAIADRAAVGTVIESSLDKQQGARATVLIQNGTLNLGDAFVAGKVHGRIRAMFDFRGHRIKKALPSTPVSITGLSEVPAAGDIFEVVEDDRSARALSAQRMLADKTTTRGPSRATTLDQYFARAKEGKSKKLYLIVKADNQGSLPPIVEMLNKVDAGEGEVRLYIIQATTGAVTETDVDLAIASGAVILGFETTMDSAAKRKAEANGVDVRFYNIIYKLIEDIELALKGMLAPKVVEKIVGTAEVKQLFKIPKVGFIAGSIVRSGVAQRNARARVLRAGNAIHTGPVGSLKRLTEDVREVRAGLECGIMVEDFECKPGDVIEFVVEETEAR
ncbi:MAG: translation initiation factor IF-2 N-terminal domain-containing protein [Anaerolineae bacterium]|nr:translation initiation factor IF-2 N-terminal domain-containing protein [Anaerolineae bacterium]